MYKCSGAPLFKRFKEYWYVCIQMYIRGHIYIYIYASIYVCASLKSFKRIHTRVCIYIYIYESIHIYIYMYLYMF